MKKALSHFVISSLCMISAFNLSWGQTMLAAQSRPRIGLVLGGGGARGLAHIGVLKALKEARVPVDCVIGTSIGALVGATFAVGRTPEEIEEMVANHDWVDTLSGGVSRNKLAYRQKRNDLLDLVKLEIGVNDRGELLFPKSAMSTQKVALFLRQATMGSAQPDFDHLATPFRAIAADIEDGSMVVLKEGDLVMAMLASMAVPGLFRPVELKGKQLVDGGIARNLPIDVARDTCADRVIVVNVGNVPMRGPKIDGIFSTADQLVRILIAKNVQPQLASLEDRDILITPELDEFGSTDFKENQKIIEQGELAAKAKLSALQQYALSESEYQAWEAGRAKARPEKPMIDKVYVKQDSNLHINASVLKERLQIKEGEKLEVEKLDERLENVYASTDLEQLGYGLETNSHGTEMHILPIEKSWGPNYLSAGISLRSDFNGHSDFVLSGLYRRTWINRLGGEWKTLIQVGETQQIHTEFYQPLVEDAWIYVAPYALFRKKYLYIPQQNDLLKRIYTSRTSVGMNIGSSLSRFGELRLGVSANRYNESEEESVRQTFGSSMTQKDIGVQLKASYDQLDNINFPSSGTFATLSGYRSVKAFGGGAKYTKADLSIAQAFKIGQLRSLWTVEVEHMSKDTPLSEYSTLGGLFNLSNYFYKSLLGRGKALAKIQFYYPVNFLTDFSERANYVGVSLEAGRVFYRVSPQEDNRNKYAYTLYWGTDTLLGPFYVAYARGDNKISRVYLMLGRNF